MNREIVRQKILEIIAENRKAKAAHKQYPAAKWQIQRLLALDLLDLMPTGFGHSDASAVLRAAEAEPTAVFNAAGEGESIPPSDLHKAIQAQQTTTAQQTAQQDPTMVTEKQMRYMRDLLGNIQDAYTNHPRSTELRANERHALTFAALIKLPEKRRDAGILINLLRDYPAPNDFMFKFAHFIRARDRARMVGEVAAEYLNNIIIVAKAVYEDDDYWVEGELNPALIDARDESTLYRLFALFS